MRTNNHPTEFYQKFATLNLPLDSADSLSFVAEAGSYVHGHLEVTQSSDSDLTAAVVDVIAFYQHPEDLDALTICRTRPDDSTWGLGIFVSLLAVAITCD